MNNNRYKNKIITIPNILSFFRILLIPIIIWLYSIKEDYMMSGFILILSGITDIIDGLIARKFNMISDFGKVIDPIADKLTQVSVLICLVIKFPIFIIIVIIMVLKELFMAITGIMITKKGEIYSAKWHGKVATFLLYCTMILHIFYYNIPNTLTIISVILCTFMISISFILYGKQNINILLKNED